MDNTIYAYEPAHKAALKAIQDDITQRFSIPIKNVADTFDKAREEIKDRLGKTASSHSRLLYLQRMLEMMGLGSQILLALEFEQTYWRTFLKTSILFDGVTEVLDEIRLLSIPTAIITDLTAQIQFRKVIYFGLENYFDYIVTSEEAGFDKPNEASFLLALNKIRPNGTNIWMIGDNPSSDIEGAKKTIGAITLQKIHKGVTKVIDPTILDASFDNFRDLQRLIKKLTIK